MIIDRVNRDITFTDHHSKVPLRIASDTTIEMITFLPTMKKFILFTHNTTVSAMKIYIGM